MPDFFHSDISKRISRAAATTVLLALLAGCGYKGPLHLPPPPAADTTLTTPPQQANELPAR